MSHKPGLFPTKRPLVAALLVASIALLWGMCNEEAEGHPRIDTIPSWGAWGYIGQTIFPPLDTIIRQDTINSKLDHIDTCFWIVHETPSFVEKSELESCGSLHFKGETCLGETCGWAVRGWDSTYICSTKVRTMLRDAMFPPDSARLKSLPDSADPKPLLTDTVYWVNTDSVAVFSVKDSANEIMVIMLDGVVKGFFSTEHYKPVPKPYVCPFLGNGCLIQYPKITNPYLPASKLEICQYFCAFPQPEAVKGTYRDSIMYLPEPLYANVKYRQITERRVVDCYKVEGVDTSTIVLIGDVTTAFIGLVTVCDTTWVTDTVVVSWERVR